MKKSKSRHTAITHPIVAQCLRFMAERADRDFSPLTLRSMLDRINISATDSTIGRRLRDLAEMGYVSRRKAYDDKGRFYRTFRITMLGQKACILSQ